MEFSLLGILIRVSLLLKDTMTKATLIRANISLELVYSFRGSPHYHHGDKHGSMQADMMLEKPKILHLDPKSAEGDSSTGIQEKALIPHWWSLSIETLNPTPTVTQFLEQGHTS